MPLDDPQPRYEHDASCGPEDLKPSESPVLNMCTECQGLFDKRTGEGILIMDRRIVG